MREFNHKFLIHIFWLTLALSFSAFAQGTSEKPVLDRREDVDVSRKDLAVATLKLNSKLMAREMSYNVILPAAYKVKRTAETRYAVVYLLHGLFGHYDNWTSKTKLALYAADYNYIFVMPEGENGWYTDSASENNDRYESYIIQELIPEIDKKFRTIADKKNRAIAGLSMGGYGALKFGLKYPETFSLAGSFSGALNAAAMTENEVGRGGVFAKSLLGTFGKADSQTRKENDIFQIVREIPKEKIKDLPFIYFDCGTEDFLLRTNREFSDLLVQRKIRHEYRQLPGAHNWTYWEAQVQEFLKLTEKFFN